MAATSPSTSPSLSPSPSTATVKSSLIKLGLKTCRGERATMNEKEQLKVLVNQLKEGADVEAMREMSCEGKVCHVHTRALCNSITDMRLFAARYLGSGDVKHATLSQLSLLHGGTSGSLG